MNKSNLKKIERKKERKKNIPDIHTHTHTHTHTPRQDREVKRYLNTKLGNIAWLPELMVLLFNRDILCAKADFETKTISTSFVLVSTRKNCYFFVQIVFRLFNLIERQP